MRSLKNTPVAKGENRRGPVVARQPRARDRVAARFSARSLDRALAAGVPSETTPALALRARRLIAVSYRRSLAQTYRRISSQARAGASPSRFNLVLTPRARVAAASDELTRLADTLTQATPVAARGVAEALLLVADGTGPLYTAGSESTIRECAARAIRDLDLRDELRWAHRPG